MELKNFVSQSIKQIAEGLAEARSATQSKGIVINPPLCMAETNGGGQYLAINTGNKKNYIPQTIQFDVLVNAETSDATEGEGKISVVGFSIGGGGSTEKKQINSSRITFSVPICWAPSCAPEQDTPSIFEGRVRTGFRPGTW